jgi:hypothetical protein
VDAIIQRKRAATPEELQNIISRAKDLKLTSGERTQLGVDLSIAMAQRARQVNGRRREDASSRFIHDTLKLAVTPYGTIEREWYEGLLRAGAESIARCKRHQPPGCHCWAESRQILWQAAHAHGDKSPQAWAALQVWEILDELESSSRPDRGPGIA